MTGKDRKTQRLILTGTLLIFLFVSVAADATPVEPTTGTMVIESIPSGASVYIDNTAQGTTPFTIHTITAGDHAVTLKMTGYADFPSTVTIPPGGEFRQV